MRRATVFAVSAGLLIYLALRGGAYGIVLRHEIALAIWWLIALGCTLGLLPRARPMRLVILPAAGLGAMMLLTTLSMSWTESGERTFDELARLGFYAGILALALLSLNRYTWRAAAAGVSVAAITVTILAVVSRLDPGAFPSAHLAPGFRPDRLNYPFNYWNAVGAWAAMALAICLAWSAHARLVITRSLSLSAVPVCGLAVYLTYSRGSVLGALVAVGAVLLMSRNRWTASMHIGAGAASIAICILVVRAHAPIAKATGAGGAGVVALTLVLAALACASVAAVTSMARTDTLRLPSELGRGVIAASSIVALVAVIGLGGSLISRGWHEFTHKDTVATATDPAKRLTTAAGNRHELWSSALRAFKANPVGGTGPGTFEFWWSRDGKGKEEVRDAHSIYIENLAELGIPGLAAVLVLFLGALGVVLYSQVFNRREEAGAAVAMSAGFGVFLIQAGVDWMWELTAVGALAVAGIAVAMAGGSRRRPRRGIGVGVRSTLVAMAFLLGLVQVPGLVSNRKIDQAQAAIRSGDLAAAQALADDAVDAEPWSASAREERALVAEQEGRLSAARTYERQAVDHERTNALRWLVLMRIDAKRHDSLALHHDYEQAKKLAPRSFYVFGYHYIYVTYPRQLAAGKAFCRASGVCPQRKYRETLRNYRRVFQAG